MPAFLAYLLTIGLLLGGGYGALSWLGEPQPPQVANRQKPKQAPERQIPLTANQGAGAVETNNPDSSGPNNTGTSTANTEHETSGVGSRQSPENASIARAPEQIDPSKNVQHPTEHPVRDAKPEVLRSSEGVAANSGQDKELAKDSRAAPVPARDRSGRTKRSSSGNRAMASVAVPNYVKRSHKPPQPSERRDLRIMTLRTIEYPDGRRVTQLLPYQGADRVYEDDNGAHHGHSRAQRDDERASRGDFRRGDRAYIVDGFRPDLPVDADDDW